MSFGQAVLLFFTYLGHWDGLNDYFKNSLHIELRYVTTYYVNFCAYFSFLFFFLFLKVAQQVDFTLLKTL